MDDVEKHLRFAKKQLFENKSNVGIKKQKRRTIMKNNLFLEEDDNVQIENSEKRERGKKRRDKDKGTGNEVEKKGESKGQWIAVDSKNVKNGAADIVEKKKKKRNKVQQRSEEENIFEPKRDKKQKMRHGLMRNSEVVDIEVGGKEDGTFEEDIEVVANVERKKRKRDKKQKKRHGLMRISDIVYIEAGGKDDVTFEEELEVAANVKRKKRKRDRDDGSTKSPRVDNDQMLETVDHGDGAVEKVKRKKKRPKNDEGDLFVPLQDNVLKNVEICNQSFINDRIVTKKGEREKNLRKKENLEDDSSVEKGSCVTTPNKSNKKVRFSDKVEVFSYLPDTLVINERFIKEEDEIVIDAVYKYIKVHDLGEKGVDMVMNCNKHRVWADVDDYRLLGILYKLDANCIEDVDWDYLIEDRDGDVCRRRWNEMVLHVGNHGNKSFAEQVEVLTQRYCPQLLEA